MSHDVQGRHVKTIRHTVSTTCDVAPRQSPVTPPILRINQARASNTIAVVEPSRQTVATGPVRAVNPMPIAIAPSAVAEVSFDENESADPEPAGGVIHSSATTAARLRASAPASAGYCVTGSELSACHRMSVSRINAIPACAPMRLSLGSVNLIRCAPGAKLIGYIRKAVLVKRACDQRPEREYEEAEQSERQPAPSGFEHQAARRTECRADQRKEQSLFPGSAVRL